ncbi:hypothetical protein SAMN05216339_10139 [Nitrosomonas eutropha]|uniref:Uncharacterized protein n=1 Tax=Nitrosomonas eutropha TaxID=916 RepID=A0A1I7EU83_9PROT|nr:hypothetical protein SAMN05216339_10139 [Nitrosomonas eutropha]
MLTYFKYAPLSRSILPRTASLDLDLEQVLRGEVFRPVDTTFHQYVKRSPELILGCGTFSQDQLSQFQILRVSHFKVISISYY